MSYFKAYKFTDSDVLDNDIKTAIGWYINNAIDKKRHSFIITLELTKGSTFSIFGMTASTPSYCAAQVFSYAVRLVRACGSKLHVRPSNLCPQSVRLVRACGSKPP